MSRKLLETTRQDRLDAIQAALVSLFAEYDDIDPSTAIGRKREALLAKKIASAERIEQALLAPGQEISEPRRKRKGL